jgi:mannose-1-phosphate guanylyltransferase
VNVFILAAGLGTRLRPLTNKYPKPCVPFLNVPLGLYPFRFLESLSVTQLTVNTHYLPEQVEDLYTQQSFFKGPIKFSSEAVILGSAGGFKQASRLFADTEDETILMMNSDEVFFGADKNFLSAAYKQHREMNSLATLVVMKHPEAGKKFGAIWCEGRTVKNIGKTNSADGQNPFHYIGIIFVNRRLLELIPPNKELNIFYDLLNFQLSQNSVHTYEIDCSWYETGNPADYMLASKTVLQNVDEGTLAFVNKYDPSTLIKGADGLSLISNSITINDISLSGYNAISKTTNPGLLKSLGSVSNSFCFGNEIVNENYFTASQP